MGTAIAALALAGVLWWAVENHRRRIRPVPAGLQTNVEIPYTKDFELYHNALSL